MKVIIIGGDAAGMSAASKLKRMDKDCRITVYEQGSYLSYAACGLPYFATNPKILKNDLIQRTREQFEASGIQAFLNHEVLNLDPEAKKVKVKNLNTGEIFEDSYEKLMIAVGAKPIVPLFPGIDLDGVLTLKTLDDGVALKERLAQEKNQNIAIIGGGYIGIEIAEALSSSGKNIRIIEMADQILMPFDPDIASFAADELKNLGVEIKLSEKLLSIEGNDRVERIVTDQGAYKADLVLMAIGVRPATDFIKDSSIQLARNGAVITDREMRTNNSDIYSAGDCAEVYHLVKEKNAYIALATTANKCGRIVGMNLSGQHQEFVGTLGSSALKVGGLELARTGLSEKEAAEMQFDYQTVTVKASSLPHYLPESTPIWFKIVYESGTKRILGAQGAGKQGVVLRIDVFASAIAGKISADELGMLDLCYSPPFSTVWDAIHIAANAIK